MRRIVEIGIANYSGIHFKQGDVYLGCDANLSLYQEQDDYTPPPDFVTSVVREVAIIDRPHVESVIFSYPQNNLHCGQIDARSGRGWRRRHVKAQTLDAFLQDHSELGFTERIDYLHIPTSEPIDKILRGFSFRVKPRVVWGHYMRDRPSVVRLFERLGYTVYSASHLLAVLHES